MCRLNATAIWCCIRAGLSDSSPGVVFARRHKILLGITGRIISRRELERLEPHITDEAVVAFEYPSSGVLSPYKLTGGTRGERGGKTACAFLWTPIAESMCVENARGFSA
jgi:hypothetical protein